MRRPIHNIDEARDLARKRLPRVLYDYVDGGAEDETTLRLNRSAYSAVNLRGRVCQPVAEPVLATTVLGTPISLPIILAPCGMVRAVHPDGDPGVARAAAAAGTISVLSVASGSPMEDTARAIASGRRWFQISFFGGRDGTGIILDRAMEAGFDHLVISVDSSKAGNREREARHQLPKYLNVSTRSAIHFGPQMARHPAWLRRFIADGMPLLPANIPNQRNGVLNLTPPSWDDIEWAVERWPGPVIVKGIMHPGDARRAVAAGAAAVVVSNHGGRQLDGLPGTFSVLPDVVDAVGGSAEVLLDGGLRRGTDIIKALAAGARAVLIGRPYIYGLAVGGQAGVELVLEIFRTEMSRALGLMNCPSVSDLDCSWIQPVDHLHPSLRGHREQLDPAGERLH